MVTLLAMVASAAALLHGERVGAQPVIEEFTIPTAASVPHGIAAGSDGNVWFTESAGNKIGRISPSGVLVEFPLRAGSGPETMTRGPDGALWFTEQNGNRIGRITTAGAITEFDITTTPGSMPHGLTTGPDGAIWFCERASNKIGRFTVSGVLTEFPLPAGFGPEPDLIISGPDGHLWFGERNGGKIGRITTAGHFAEFVPPVQLAAGTQTYTHGITVAPDGAIWFTEQRADRIGRITLCGDVTDEILLPYLGNMPHALLVGPDGALWFTEQGPPAGNKIGRITVDTREITEFPLPNPASQPFQMAVGPDGALWFTESATNANKIGRLVPFAAGGSFVIGDLDAVVGNSVVFWGEEWSKANHLSGGRAPAGFKGFEDSSALPDCGTTWTSRPGNSARPPASVAPVMSVIVASAISRSGATITGNVRAIALIDTDPGDGSDLEHTGRGTVVKVVRCPLYAQTLGTHPRAVANADPTFPFSNCLAAEGCFGKDGLVDVPGGNFPAAFTFNFTLTPAQVAAVTASQGVATLSVVAARDIGQHAGAAVTDWLVATADGMGLGNLFENTKDTCPAGERGSPGYGQNLACGPNFHTDVAPTDTLVIPQPVFQAAAADGNIQIVLIPTAGVGRLKIFSVTLQDALP